jgi:hypothetical protein
MYSIIREIVFYVLFLYLMMMVAYGNRDPWSSSMYNNYKNMFFNGVHHTGKYMEFTIDAVKVVI